MYDHLAPRLKRAIARADPAERHRRGVIVVDQAAGHRGALLTQVLAAHPPLERDPLPSDRPKLPVIERLWKLLRRRATHKRLFATMATRKQALRSSLCSDQTRTHRLVTLLASRRKRTKSPDA